MLKKLHKQAINKNAYRPRTEETAHARKHTPWQDSPFSCLLGLAGIFGDFHDH